MQDGKRGSTARNGAGRCLAVGAAVGNHLADEDRHVQRIAQPDGHEHHAPRPRDRAVRPEEHKGGEQDQKDEQGGDEDSEDGDLRLLQKEPLGQPLLAHHLGHLHALLSELVIHLASAGIGEHGIRSRNLVEALARRRILVRICTVACTETRELRGPWRRSLPSGFREGRSLDLISSIHGNGVPAYGRLV